MANGNIDLEAIRKEAEEAGNYEHDGCIVVRTDSVRALLAEVERLRGEVAALVRMRDAAANRGYDFYDQFGGHR